MYKILKAEKLAEKIYLMDIEAPRVAKSCEPGQFIIAKLDEKGERIPLTICDYDREAGIVTIVFQEVGASTIKMAKLQTGDYLEDFVGPLGCASDLVYEDIEELKKLHSIELDKRKFVDKYPCNAFGYTKLKVELFKNVIGTIKVHVSEKK